MDRPTFRVWLPGLSRIFHTGQSVDLSLLVVVVESSLLECAMQVATCAGYHRTTLNQMFMPTYLSSNVFATLEICILTSTNHGLWRASGTATS